MWKLEIATILPPVEHALMRLARRATLRRSSKELEDLDWSAARRHVRQLLRDAGVFVAEHQDL